MGPGPGIPLGQLGGSCMLGGTWSLKGAVLEYVIMSVILGICQLHVSRVSISRPGPLAAVRHRRLLMPSPKVVHV